MIVVPSRPESVMGSRGYANGGNNLSMLIHIIVTVIIEQWGLEVVGILRSAIRFYGVESSMIIDT